MQRRNSERGLTFVTVLMVLGLAAGVYWIIVFGGVYWDNHEVKAILRQAGNVSYTEKSDERVRGTIERQFNDNFGNDQHKTYLEYVPEDLRLERTTTPPMMKIDFRYSRTVTLPIFGGQRQIFFEDHIEQDLATVKW